MTSQWDKPTDRPALALQSLETQSIEADLMTLLKRNPTFIPEVRAALTVRFQPLGAKALRSGSLSRDAGRLKISLAAPQFCLLMTW